MIVQKYKTDIILDLGSIYFILTIFKNYKR